MRKSATGIGTSRFPFALTRLKAIIAGDGERFALDFDQGKTGDQP
jgi:hypothetical protein